MYNIVNFYQTFAENFVNVFPNIILNKVVILQNIQKDKYGHILADVYLKKLHLNSYMLKKRLAVVYDGGTKISPKNWLNYHHTGEL